MYSQDDDLLLTFWDFGAVFGETLRWMDVVGVMGMDYGCCKLVAYKET